MSMEKFKKLMKNFSMWMKLFATIFCLANYFVIYLREPFLDYEKTKFYYQRDIIVVATILFFFVTLILLALTFYDQVPYKLEIQLLSIGAVMNLVSFILCIIYYVGQEDYVLNSTLLIVVFSILASLTMAMAMAKDCAIMKTEP